MFVGYQVQGTLGSHIKNGEKKIRLLGVELPVKAKVESINSYSAHAGSKGLMDWVKDFKPKPKGIFLIHGEPES